MNKRRRNNNEPNDGSAAAAAAAVCGDDDDDDDSLDEDVDESSIRGCKARSSVPDADSTVGAGGGGRGLLLVKLGEEGKNATDRPAVVADEYDDDRHHHRDDDGGGGGGTVRSRWVFYRWWTNVVSRVSRSASSLLNQHSPNLNDILESASVLGDGPPGGARSSPTTGMGGGGCRSPRGRRSHC